MPANVPPELEDKFRSCKEKVIAGGEDEQAAYGICYAAVVEGKADAASLAGKYGFILDPDTVKTAAKFMSAPVKAVGDWELDVLALPFDKLDSDQQYFDARTDTMPGIFSNPAIIYHHGVQPGAGEIEQRPVIIGKATAVTKQADGWHVRVLLDKTLEYARRVWEAAKRGLAVASSDSIAHLARLEVSGKNMMYEKNRAGRISVWPLAGLSLWDMVEGNFRPASRYAIALPAMKAIYREAGIPFPAVTAGGTDGDLSADNTAAKRAQTTRMKQEIEDFLNHLDHQ